jgi:hypothetical protein
VPLSNGPARSQLYDFVRSTVEGLTVEVFNLKPFGIRSGARRQPHREIISPKRVQGVASSDATIKRTRQACDTPRNPLGPLLTPVPIRTLVYGQLGDTCLIDVTFSFAISARGLSADAGGVSVIPFAIVPVTSTLWPT